MIIWFMLALVMCARLMSSNPRLLESLKLYCDMEKIPFAIFIVMFVFLLFFCTSPLAFCFHLLARFHG